MQAATEGGQVQAVAERWLEKGKWADTRVEMTPVRPDSTPGHFNPLQPVRVNPLQPGGVTPRTRKVMVGIEGPEGTPPPTPNVPRETGDPWSAACGTCGHPKRAHLGPTGELGRCGFGANCGCRRFEEGDLT